MHLTLMVTVQLIFGDNGPQGVPSLFIASNLISGRGVTGRGPNPVQTCLAGTSFLTVVLIH